MFSYFHNSKLFDFFFIFFADIVEMSCSEKTALNISIPIVMISKLGGDSLIKSLSAGAKGNHLVNALLLINLCIGVYLLIVICLTTVSILFYFFCIWWN